MAVDVRDRASGSPGPTWAGTTGGGPDHKEGRST